MLLALCSVQGTRLQAGNTVPVTFKLKPSAAAAALQFDINCSAPGYTSSILSLTGAAIHHLDSQTLASGATRYVVYCTSNALIAAESAVTVKLDLQTALPANGIVTVSNVLASDANGNSVPASPGTIPVFKSQSPAAGETGVIGKPIQTAVEVVDLDGQVTSVSFLLDGQTAGTDATVPFSAGISSATAGTKSLIFRAQDNQGNIADSSAVSLRFIDPALLTSFSAWNATWLSGAGSFSGDWQGNRVANGISWALGLDPRSYDRSGLPVLSVESNGQGRTLVYRARLLPMGPLYQVLGSATMAPGSWSPLPASQVTQTIAADGWRIVEARVPAGAGQPVKFLRLQIQQP